MPELTPILAENDGKSVLDALQAIFAIVIALISVFGTVVGRFLKKKKSGDGTNAPEIGESAFGTPEAEEDGGENFATDYETIPWISDEESDDEDAATAEPFPRSAVTAEEIFPAAASVPATAAVASVPAERKSAPERPALKSRPAAAQMRKNVPAHNSADGLLGDREALRRAVLAQEILSPPLALRE